MVAQMKATEKRCRLKNYIWLVYDNFDSLSEIIRCEHSTESYRAVISCGAVNSIAVLTFESVNEILTCDHSIESYQAILSCGTVYYAVKSGSNF